MPKNIRRRSIRKLWLLLGCWLMDQAIITEIALHLPCMRLIHPDLISDIAMHLRTCIRLIHPDLISDIAMHLRTCIRLIHPDMISDIALHLRPSCCPPSYRDDQRQSTASTLLQSPSLEGYERYRTQNLPEQDVTEMLLNVDHEERPETPLKTYKSRE